MKKLLLFLMIGMFLISSVYALDDLGTYQKDQCVNIKQTCATCSYVNLTIAYPNSTIILNNKEMSDQGAGTWTYDFCNTSLNGRYDVTGKGDLDGTDTSFATYFHVTPSGNINPSSGEGLTFLGSLIAMILVAGIFFFLSVSMREHPGARFAFIALTVVTSIIVVLYSSVALMETFWGFDKIISSYSTFLWVFLFTIFIIFIFVLIAIIIRAVDSLKIKRGLKEH